MKAITRTGDAIMNKLDQTFFFHQQVMNLRTERQQIIASNIANADTPHYKARDLDFAKVLEQTLAGRPDSGVQMARTSTRHLAASAPAQQDRLLYRNEYQSAVDGNTVEMDVERANFSDNAIRYEAGVTFVTQRFKGLLDAMQNPRG